MKNDYIDIFLNALSQQQNKRSVLSEFCRQYHYFSWSQIKAFSMMLLRSDQLNHVAICDISKTIYEEYGSGNPERIHSVLFEKMAYACGVNKGELPLSADRVFPSIKRYIQELHQAFSTGALAEAYGAYVFLEKTAVTMYPRFLKTLKTMGFNEDELEFFTEHAYLEPKHLETAYTLVENQNFSTGELNAYEKQLALLDDCYREFWISLNQTLDCEYLAVESN